MISCPTIRKSEIRFHYDLSTAFYRLLWGPHIHHGLWNGEESSDVAQRQLIDAVAQRADIRGGEKVLDVGCGMGGSSVYLVRHFDCRVTGVTLSPVQRRWAQAGAPCAERADEPRFCAATRKPWTFPRNRSMSSGASNVRNISSISRPSSDVPRSGLSPADE